jgi:multidrug efflux system membrane fusion protein
MLAVAVLAGAGVAYYWDELRPLLNLTAEATPRPAAAPRAVPVVVATVSREALPIDVTVIGTVQPSETVSVRSRVDGEIQAMEFKEGDEVKAGALLFVLDSRQIQAQLRQAESNLVRDRAMMESIKADLDRKSNLAQRDYTSRSALDQARAAFDALQGTIKAGEAAVDGLKIQLSYTTIRAPIDGRTGAVTVTRGSAVRVNESAAMVVINRIQPVKVNFAIPQKYFDLVRKALAGGQLNAYAKAQGGSNVEAPGVIYFFDNAIDTTTGTFQLRASFPNEARSLWPGMLADVVARLGVEQDAIVVPSAAVSIGQRGPFVFVIKPDMTAEIRDVKVSREAGDRTVVTSGLKEGEQVVVDGQIRLANGTRVDVKTAPGDRKATGAAPTGKGS